MANKLKFLTERDLPDKLMGGNAADDVADRTGNDTMTSKAAGSSIDPTSSSSYITSGSTNSTHNRTMITGAFSTPEHNDSGSETAGTAIAVVITLVLLTVFIVFTFFFLKKKGKLPCFPVTRPRRSSTSDSRRALDANDENELQDNHKPHGEREDMFTIDDLEEDQQERGEEYYYDEVFGQSEFEDQAIKNATRELYSSGTQGDEELLDFDFETLGIKIDDYVIDPSRKNTV